MCGTHFDANKVDYKMYVRNTPTRSLFILTCYLSCMINIFTLLIII